MHLTKVTRVVLLSGAVAVAQQPAYAQCGGSGWAGDSSCLSGYVCAANGDYYSQCVPGEASPDQASPTVDASTSTTISGGSSSASGPGTTLQSGYYWIRAVEAPNFHKYLQTKPEYSTGTAILDSYTTAGQFQIVSGQLVQNIGGGNLLYANVIQPANVTAAKKLAMTFNTTKNTFGTFAFGGDAVQWTVPSITRPNLSAWLVCANQQLFINLGNYDYMTPAGCADETIHYYNDKTAVS